MNRRKLFEILADTTVQLRLGERVERRAVGPVEVTEINNMPAVGDAPASMVTIDLTLLAVGVDAERAAARRDELVALLNEYPEPERLAAGPSYIEVGGEIGDQGAAFQLFALGEVLGLWKVITPATLGVSDQNRAREMAGRGFVLITGYRRP